MDYPHHAASVYVSFESTLDLSKGIKIKTKWKAEFRTYYSGTDAKKEVR